MTVPVPLIVALVRVAMEVQAAAPVQPVQRLYSLQRPPIPILLELLPPVGWREQEVVRAALVDQVF